MPCSDTRNSFRASDQDAGNVKEKKSLRSKSIDLPSLDIDQAYAFKYDDAAAEEAEQQIEERKNEIKNIIQQNGMMGLEIEKPDGRREILTPSVRQGVKWQLTYIGSDGMPTMHENYGQTSENHVNEAIHTEDELYTHFANMTMQEPLTMETLTNEQNEASTGGTRYSRRASTDATQEQEALNEVTDDPELYAQVAGDADIRAAWQLLMRLHRLTTQGGENALIRKGAFEQRLSEIVQKIDEKTGTKYGPIKLRQALRKIYQAMENSQYSPGEILQYARGVMKDVLDASPGVLVEQDETTKEILAGLKRRRFYLTDDQKNEIKNTYGTVSRFRQKNFGTLNIGRQDGKTASLEDVWREDLAPMLPSVFAEDTSPLDMPGILDAWLENTKEKKYAGEFGHNIGAYATSARRDGSRKDNSMCRRRK